MNYFKIIKSWVNKFKAFFVLMLMASICLQGQNSRNTQINAHGLQNIVINGNQIFNITVRTSKVEYINITSVVDGEYQNFYQVVMEQNLETLSLRLERLPLTSIADNKRNAHKVVAADLNLEIPENLNLTITSDIGLVDVKGKLNLLYIELIQGNCKIYGTANNAKINTIDGDIFVVTKDAKVSATSNHGAVIIDEFIKSIFEWNLKSINGDITVVEEE